MVIIPAIDLLDSKVVRLEKGKENTAVVYDEYPEKTARKFETAGARWIHVVDLDGAFGRADVNRESLLKIIQSVSCGIELGGGIRSYSQAEYWLKAGIGRVILGSAAIENPRLVEKLLNDFGPEQIIAGLDLKDGKVSVNGWQKTVQKTGLQLAREMAHTGLIRTIVTDIDTDGMLAGPKLDEMLKIAESTGLKVIVSGGVSEWSDLHEISGLQNRGLEGAIIGKALYENRIDLKNVIKHFQTRGE